ncbi:unnamed protein product [marine sediment metagenome]|uniref:Uncharacterized protein n=1 Tax=marine sediment metagenome TaxID=412755 RepID=X0SQ21_9ZZZZ
MGEVLSQFTAGDELEAAKLNSNLQDARDGKKEIQTEEAIDTTSLPIPIYIAAGSGWVGKCDANVVTKLEFVGFALKGQNIGIGEFIQIMVGEGGIVGGFSGLDRGSKYYVQDDGTIGTSVGTYEVLVGVAISATEILILKGSGEYMGSEAVSASEGAANSVDTATMPANARTAIIVIDFNSWTAVGNEGSCKGQVIIKRKGSSSVSLWIPGTGINNIHKLLASLSTNTITITVTNGNGTSLSGNVYYYR